MRRRIRPLILAAAVLTLTLAAAAQAVPPRLAPPSPNHTVVDVLGRRLVTFNHGGDPALGQAKCSAQGETVDSNGNSLADALRGRAACQEYNRVVRLRITAVTLEVFHAETWQTVARDDEDAVSEANPARVVWYTPVPSFCPDNIDLTYRVRLGAGIRWDDGTASNVTVTSGQFQARATVNTQVC